MKLTSLWKILSGGIKAIGSTGWGLLGSLWGLGLWSSVTSTHLTHSYPVNLRDIPVAPCTKPETLTHTFPLTVYPEK